MPGEGVMDSGEWGGGAHWPGDDWSHVTDEGLHGADPQQTPCCSAPASSVYREALLAPALKPTSQKSLPRAQEINRVGGSVAFLQKN